jgi:PiT family inorganic phosphate transporter
MLITMYKAFSIGANDETTAPAVSGRALTVNKAVLLGSAAGLLGAIILGENVQRTVGADILLTPITERIVFVVVFAASSWLTFISYKGYPVSTTHSLLGGLLAYGLLSNGPDGINWPTVNSILKGWVISIASGFIGAYLLGKFILWIERNNPSKGGSFEGTFVYPLLVASIGLEFSRWGNDVGNVSGVLYGFFAPIVSRAFCGAVMAMGLIVLGRRVIRTAGEKLVRLPPSGAFIAQIIAIPIVFCFARLGIPLSGTDTMIAAILGAGVARRADINPSTLLRIVGAKLATLPAAGAIAAVLFFVLNFVAR